MAHRSTPLVLLVWLLLLAMAGALWMLLAGAPPTEFGPAARAAPDEIGNDAPRAPAQAVWTLDGRVRGQGYRSLDGVRVEVDGRRVETGSDGGFEVPDLPWREHDVAFWKEGYRLETRRVTPGDHPDVRLRPLLSVSGVVQLPDGARVVGHGVTLRCDDETVMATATDGDGAFTFERVPAGGCSVRAAARADAGEPYGARSVRTSAGVTEPVVLELPPAAAFEGLVSDPDGRPVEGAECRARYYQRGSRRNGEVVTTGADGRFVLVVPRDQECTVLVETPLDGEGWRYLRWFRHKQRPENGPLDVRLEPGLAIAGRVTAPRGVVVAGRAIAAWRIAGNGRSRVTGGFVRDDGTFRIGGLWDAEYELRLEGAWGNDDPHVLSRGYRVKSGTSDLVIALVAVRPFGGRIVDAAGAAVANRMLLIKQDDAGWVARTKTGADGRFELPRTAPGLLRVLVYRPGRNNGVVEGGEWHSGDTSVDIRLAE